MHDSLKERVRDAIDIVDLISERVQLQSKGREFLGLCPFHNDRNPSMAVSPEKQIFKCWSCGVGGDAFKFVQLAYHMEFKDALRMLAERAGISLEQSPQDSVRAARREQLHAVMEWALQHFRRNFTSNPGRAAAEYARRRGLGDAWIERLQIGFAPDAWDDLLQAGTRAGLDRELLHAAGLITTNERNRTYDRFRNRLIFPIFDVNGRCVAFGGRTLGDDQAKYLNSPETPLFSKSRILYGLNFARDAVRSERHAIVVEGYFDAALLYEAGVPAVVATLGVALTDGHLKSLAPLADKLYFCFDNDEAGLRAADRAAETALQRRMDVRVMLIPDGKDPADFVQHAGREEFNNLLHSSKPALEFKWQQTLRAFQASGDFDRRDAVAAFLAFVTQASSAGGINVLEQGLMMSRLAELLSVPAEQVYRMLGEQRNRRRSPAQVVATESDSEYAVSIRRMPSGLVRAVEELFGAALREPALFERVFDSLAAAAALNRWWQALLDVFDQALESADRNAPVASVLATLDGPVLDLVNAARRAWPAERAVDDEIIEALRRRISLELQDNRREQLASQLGGNDDQGRAARAFEALVRVAKQQNGAGTSPSVLSASQRWRALAQQAARDSSPSREENNSTTGA